MSDVEKTEFELPPELARQINSPIDAAQQSEERDYERLSLIHI